MKKCFLLAALICGVFLFACGGGGGGGGSSSSTGSLTVAITDAKPVLPTGIAQFVVTIDEVSVHKAGGDWIFLPLAQTPFTIDLLQFTDGHTTQLVPETILTPGMYTQVRLGIYSATIITDTGAQIPVVIPSGNLKTDKNFEFDVKGGGAVVLTVDFDLSQSLVSKGDGSFSLKPVLHLVTTVGAATIIGSFAAATFGSQSQATIIVSQDSDNSGNLTPGDEEYTRFVVTKGTSGTTAFSIYWLVPNHSYIVQVQIGGIIVYSQTVTATTLPPASVYPLRSNSPI